MLLDLFSQRMASIHPLVILNPRTTHPRSADTKNCASKLLAAQSHRISVFDDIRLSQRTMECIADRLGNGARFPMLADLVVTFISGVDHPSRLFSHDAMPRLHSLNVTNPPLTLFQDICGTNLTTLILRRPTERRTSPDWLNILQGLKSLVHLAFNNAFEWLEDPESGIVCRVGDYIAPFIHLKTLEFVEDEEWDECLVFASQFQCIFLDFKLELTGNGTTSIDVFDLMSALSTLSGDNGCFNGCDIRSRASGKWEASMYSISKGRRDGAVKPGWQVILGESIREDATEAFIENFLSAFPDSVTLDCADMTEELFDSLAQSEIRQLILHSQQTLAVFLAYDNRCYIRDNELIFPTLEKLVLRDIVRTPEEEAESRGLLTWLPVYLGRRLLDRSQVPITIPQVFCALQCDDHGIEGLAEMILPGMELKDAVDDYVADGEAVDELRDEAEDESEDGLEGDGDVDEAF